MGLTYLKEEKVEVEVSPQVQVMVFGNRLQESCTPGG